MASVLSRIADRNIRLVYAASLPIGMANGLSLALTALHLDARGFTKQDIGSLAVWFAIGVAGLAVPAGAAIRVFSAKATLVFSLIGYAIAVGAFPYMRSFAGVGAARFADGAFSVGMWVALETILLARAAKDDKAFVTSLYAVCTSIGYVAGPLAASAIVRVAPMRVAFVCAAAVALLAAVIVALRLDRDRPVGPVHPLPEPLPEKLHEAVPTAVVVPDETPHPTALQLLWKLKTACFATFSYGYFQASVVLFLPLYLMETKHIPEAQTIIVPAFFAAGMLIFTNVFARLGDRFGHLFFMRLLGAAGGLMVLGFVYLNAFPAMCAAVFVSGAAFASLWPLALALSGSVLDKKDYSRATATFNVFYASGMLLGPAISSRIFGRLGGIAMLFHIAALWGAFVVFSTVFFRDDPRSARRRLATQSG